jgi:GT2 family glycosyltransferase
MKIAFYFCTRGKDPKETLAYKSLSRIKDINILFHSQNSIGLSARYNEILESYSSKYDYLVFLHDDVYVDDLSIYNKLKDAHEQYDIVGLAGGINPRIQKPALWHLMCGGFGGGNLRGAVAHPTSPNQIGMTSFGVTPCRVAILDGLFLSIKTKSIQNTNWKFNTNYTFHHYDIASCLDANKKKLKLGVVPIWVIHSSPGLLNIEDKLFTSSQEKFISEYANSVV